jgi:uncharacterized protein YecE (DUF72 family)
MTTLHAGSAGFDRPRARYAKKLSFVEIDLRPPMPAPKVLARWRGEVGQDFVFALVAPPSLWGERDWPLRDPEATRKELDRLGNVVHLLAPRAIVLRTPAAMRPGTVAFKRFLELVERVKKLAPVCVWEPQGVWERDEAREATEGTGLIVAADPLRDDVAGEPIVYARMRGLGTDTRYHTGRLEDLLIALEDAQEAFVVFDTPSGSGDALRLMTVLNEAAAEEEESEEEPEESEEEGDEGDEDEDADDEDDDADGDEEFDEDDEDDDADEDDEDDDADEDDEDEDEA